VVAELVVVTVVELWWRWSCARPRWRCSAGAAVALVVAELVVLAVPSWSRWWRT
jgi:hypothetical protein